MTMLDRALFLESLGLSVFPLAPRSKTPPAEWKDHQTWRATREAITGWWSNGGADQNIAVACGPVSGVFVLDIDGPEGEASLTVLEAEHGPLPATWRVKTARGRHYWFKDSGLRNTASKLGDHIDTRGDGGLVVAPGSVHPTGAIYDWEPGFDPEFTNLAELPAWIADRLTSVPKHQPPAKILDFNSTPRQRSAIDNREEYRVRRYLESMISGAEADLAGTREGARNQTLNDKAMWLGHFSHYGVFDQDQAWLALSSGCVKNGSWAEDGDRRCRATFESGWKAGTADPRSDPENDRPQEIRPVQTLLAPVANLPRIDDSGSTPWCAAELVGRAPAREWLVSDWLPAKTITSLYGDGGIGKTLVAQQLAAAHAVGGNWCGLPVPKGRCLAVFCEDDRNEVWRRQDDIDDHMGTAMRSTQLQDLYLWDRVGFDNIMQNFDREGAGSLQPFFATLSTWIEKLMPSLLVLDTAADVFGGNENVRAQVNHFVKSTLGSFPRRFGTTVLLLAHPSQAGLRKDKDKNGETTGASSGTSGSTAWNNAVRCRWYLERAEGGSDQRILTRKKSNYSASGDDQKISLFWERGVLTTIPAPATVDRMTLHALKSMIISIVGKAWDDDIPIGSKNSSRYWKEVVPYKIQGHDPSAVARAFVELEREGAISIHHGNSRKRGYKVVRSEKSENELRGVQDVE